MSDILQIIDKSPTDRARVQLMLSMIAEIAGFDPAYISTTPGVKPANYDGSGTPYGWYVRSVGGEQYIQPLVWNAGSGQWDHVGSPTVTLNALNNRLSDLETDLKESSGFILSDIQDGSGTDVTASAAITNIISLTQAEYDALAAPLATTLYIITEPVWG